MKRWDEKTQFQQPVAAKIMTEKFIILHMIIIESGFKILCNARKLVPLTWLTRWNVAKILWI